MPKLPDQDAIKGFFVYHVEKIVLVVVLLLFVFFVYRGMSLEGLENNKSPDNLQALSSQADEYIVQDTWDVIAEEHEPPSGFEVIARESNVATKDLPYALSKPLMPSTSPSGVKRIDPELLPPIEVEADAIVGPVAYIMKKGEEDPLLDEPNSEPKKDETKKKKSRRKNRRNSDTMAGGMGGMGMEGYAEMMSEEMAGEEMGGMMGGMASMGAMGGSMGGAGGVSAAGRDFPGFRPSSSTRSIIAKSRAIVSVKALVPYREQWDKYEQAFAEAMDYNPTRDVPKYLMFVAERAEVPADPDAELKWVRAATTNSEITRLRTSQWAGLPQEIADPRYAMPNVLTMPVPPIMMRKLDRLALHSKVPRIQAQQNLMTKADEDDESNPDPMAAVSEALDEDVPGAIPGGGMQPGMPGGMPGMPGGMPGMTGGMPGMPGGMPGMEGGMEGMASEEYASAMGGMMGGMMGDDADDGYGMMSMMGGAAPGPQVDYILVRFFDFVARPGRKYRYRVQVLVEDPNHPQNPNFEPRERALDDEVKQRLATVLKQEESSNRVYYQRTDWSEPSNEIEVELPVQTLAGEVVTPRTISIPNAPKNQFELEVDEATAKVMAIVYDPTRAVDVPGIKEAARGTLLNFTSTADVVHPVNLQFKMLENFQFATDRLLVDFRGGQAIPGTADEEDEESEPLLAPSELIFLDEDGNFFVKNDLDDQDAFELFRLPEATGPATTGDFDMGGMEGMDGMMDDLE